MGSDTLKIIYIAGDNHCGSTLVGRILGQVPGVFMAGEIRDLWSRGVKDRVPCSCGQPMPDCELWGEVLRRSTPDPAPGVEAMIGLQWEPTRSRHVELLWANKNHLAAQWSDLIAYTRRLYEAVADVSGCRVIVDTSKAPFYAAVLSLIPEFDLRCIHLVRDPRGSAFSWFQRRVSSARKKGLEHRGRPGEAAISLRWLAINALCERVGRAAPGRSMRLRYEDFLAEAEGSLERILLFAGEAPPPAPIVVNNEVEIRPGHIGLGNPSRGEIGRTALRRDDRWRSSMSAFDKAAIAALTLPLFVGYGYHRS